MQTITCANCGNHFTGSFCNICGQKSSGRYSLTHIFHELLHSFTHADKGIFSFTWQIMIRPGTVALHLVQGSRKKYFNLFQFLLIIVGIVTFIVNKSNFMEDNLKSINSLTGTQASNRMLQTQKDVMELVQHYFNVLQLLLIPVYALFSWLWFRRRGYNYAENIVLQSAITSQVTIYSIILMGYFIIFQPAQSGLLHSVLSIIIIIFCSGLAYHQFLKISIGRSLLFALLIYICSYLVQLVLITCIAIVYLIIAGK